MLTLKASDDISIIRVENTQGYDGHSFRAYYYFGDQMTGIDPNDVKSINSIASLYPDLRQDSKAPTFALTYQGTYRTMMTNLGWAEAKSRSVETNYHKMYQVSDTYKEARLKQASKDGYATVAFGLRVRTPVLGKAVYGERTMTNMAAAEGRTVGNAFGQSYGMLNNRAAIKVIEDTERLGLAEVILPSCLIHDANYWLCERRLSTLKALNDSVGKHMSWCDMPELFHSEVGLEGQLDVFEPSWAYTTTLPNYASKDEILALLS